MELNDLSPNAKVWIYQAKRPFTPDELSKVQDMGERFVHDWSAHGTSLKACFKILYDRFLAFFVDESEQEATGCSIDRSVHFIKGIENEFDLDLMDRRSVAYKDGEGISTIPFDRLDEAVQNGILTKDSTVFNNLVRTKKEFEEGWEVPLKDSWHARMLSFDRPIAE